MFTSYIKALFFAVAKRCYTIYNIIRIKAGHGIKLSHSIKVEGKGSIILGNYVELERNVTIGCSAGNLMRLGDKNVLQEGAALISYAKLSTGKQFSFGNFSRGYANDDWAIGDNVTIGIQSQVFSREAGLKGKLQIGDNSFVGDFSILDMSAGINIGNNVALGPRCTIYTHDHDYTTANVVAPWKGKANAKPVVIEDSVWVGANVVIMPGVTIGKGAIIAAGAIVTKDIPANTLNIGAPSKVIKVINNGNV